MHGTCIKTITLLNLVKVDIAPSVQMPLHSSKVQPENLSSLQLHGHTMHGTVQVSLLGIIF